MKSQYHLRAQNICICSQCNVQLLTVAWIVQSRLAKCTGNRWGMLKSTSQSTMDFCILNFFFTYLKIIQLFIMFKSYSIHQQMRQNCINKNIAHKNLGIKTSNKIPLCLFIYCTQLTWCLLMILDRRPTKFPRLNNAWARSSHWPDECNWELQNRQGLTLLSKTAIFNRTRSFWNSSSSRDD